MPLGKFFTLHSKLNDLVLDIEGGRCNPGSKVVTWNAKPAGKNDNQVWYEDHPTGTIRPWLNSNMVLDVDSTSTLIVNTHKPGAKTQRWRLDGDIVRNRSLSTALDIAGGNKQPGSRVCSWTTHDGAHQRWKPNYLPPKYFQIVNTRSNMVLDIKGSSTVPGSDVIMFPAAQQANQYWYEDNNGIIRSQLGNLALDKSSGYIRVNPYDPNDINHQWMVGVCRIQHRFDPSLVLDIAQNNQKRGAKLCPYVYHGGENQNFRIEYV